MRSYHRAPRSPLAIAAATAAFCYILGFTLVFPIWFTQNTISPASASLYVACSAGVGSLLLLLRLAAWALLHRHL